MVLIIVGIVVVFIFICIIIRNGVIGKKNQVENSFAGIDVQLTKRYDLIPNLVTAVKEYMNHEKETLTQLTELRTRAVNSNIDNNEKIKLDNQISSSLGKIMVSVENYPDLKSNTNFIQLQSSLNEVEEQLAAARRFFNSSVTDYNNALEMFPSSIFASQLNYQRKELFIAPDIKRADVSLKELF
jgi:LemA protein